METKEISTAALASLSTGTLLCNLGEAHEAAEHLMGHSIWTHHFASKELWDKMREAVLTQCPNMPTNIEGVTAENYREHVARLNMEFGETQTIKRGDGATAQSPLDGIPDHLKDKTIILET